MTSSATSNPPAAADPHTSDPTPLLTYASTHHFPPPRAAKSKLEMEKQVSRITFDLSKDPPPETNCAQTLGAKRFAALFEDLARAYSELGERREAVEAYAKAIGCNPRADFLHAELAAALLDQGQYGAARLETQRRSSLGRGDFTLHTVMTQLDFIEDRWPEAVSDARLAATEAPTDEQATYWQCFLWLAQMRAGSHEPALANRRTAPAWPAPILESLEGRIDEPELVEAVRAEGDDERRREILSEALFYTGEQRLATHRTDEAARYFTATIKLNVSYFIEHRLAMAELEKLRHPR